MEHRAEKYNTRGRMRREKKLTEKAATKSKMTQSSKRQIHDFEGNAGKNVLHCNIKCERNMRDRFIEKFNKNFGRI